MKTTMQKTQKVFETTPIKNLRLIASTEAGLQILMDNLKKELPEQLEHELEVYQGNKYPE